MFFTREDINKIHQALLKLSIKDSELPETSDVKNDDTLAIVQDGKNKQINIREFFNNISLFKREAFINITDRFNKHSISLIEAIQTVPIHQRINGLVITFEDANKDWRIYQFRGNNGDFFNEERWADLYDYRNYIIESFLPDEEDITALAPDKNRNSLLALKDRIYNPSVFSGKGYKIIRKNIISVELATTKISVIEPTTLEGDIDFIINNKEIRIHLSPTIHNTTKIVAKTIKDAIAAVCTDYEIDIIGNIVTLIHKYSGNVFSTTFEMYNTGVKVITKDYITNTKRNVITKDMISIADTVYEIRYDFDLDGKTIAIPKNCILYFTSGNFYNGELIMDNTTVSAFDKDILSEISIRGNYYNIQKYIEDTKTLFQNSIDKLNDTVYPITLGFTVSPNTGTMQTDVRYFVTSDGKPLVPDTLEVTKQINDNTSKVLTNAKGSSGTVQTKIEGGREIFKFAVTKIGRTSKSTLATRYLCYYGSSSVKDMTAETMSTLSKVSSTGVSFNPQISTNNDEYIWLIVPNYLTINKVTSAGFEVTLATEQIITNSFGTFKAYRTINVLTSAIWKLVIS